MHSPETSPVIVDKESFSPLRGKTTNKYEKLFYIKIYFYKGGINIAQWLDHAMNWEVPAQI